MSGHRKVVILGGGLAGGLLAYRLAQKGFKKFLIIDQGSQFGGDHTWSFFDSDVHTQGVSWVEPFRQFQWVSHKVRFSDYERSLSEGYNTCRSEHFSKILCRVIPKENRWMATKVTHVSHGEIVVNGDRRVKYDHLIDARGRGFNSFGPCGYQKFVGQDLQFDRPHKLKTPIIMDASVEQLDGFRFMYVLPLTPTRLLVEDTRYSRSPLIDEDEFDFEIQSYVTQKFLGNYQVVRQEKGCLALPLTMTQYQQPADRGQYNIGLRAGMFQPVTGYSFPYAARWADQASDWLVSDLKEFPDRFRRALRREKSKARFFFLLNRMMFGAATDANRWRIFDRFYRLNESMIQNFYRGELSLADKVRLLSGRPPVPVSEAIRSLADSEWMRQLPQPEARL